MCRNNGAGYETRDSGINDCLVFCMDRITGTYSPMKPLCAGRMRFLHWYRGNAIIHFSCVEGISFVLDLQEPPAFALARLQNCSVNYGVSMEYVLCQKLTGSIWRCPPSATACKQPNRCGRYSGAYAPPPLVGIWKSCLIKPSLHDKQVLITLPISSGFVRIGGCLIREYLAVPGITMLRNY